MSIEGMVNTPADLHAITFRQVETVDWVCCNVALPDTDTTVLINLDGASEPVWLGYFDEATGLWHLVDGPSPADTVVAWATMPAGWLALREAS